MSFSNNKFITVLVAFGVASHMLLPVPRAMAAVQNWNVGTGDWFTPGSWSGGVPAAVDFTTINNGGTAQILSGAATTNLLNIGNNAGNTGTVTVQNNATTLTANIISVGSNDATAAGTLNILGGGTVTSGNLSIGINDATGTLNIAGGGVLNVTNQILVGNDAVSTAIFNIGTGGAAGVVNAPSLTSAGGANGTVNFNHTDTDYYFTNDGTSGGTAVLLEGSLLVNHTGSGTSILAGIHTYTGATTINAGTLSVNGSIANSTTTVNSSGTLSGTGTVGVVTLNGGAIAPGNSIGTLSLTGDIDFSSGGVYQVEVDAAGNSDLITATGTATLTNGAVQVQPEAGNYAETTDYTILTAAGGLGGTSFDSVSSSLAFLTPTLSYDGNNVFLSLVRNDLPANPSPSNPGPSNVSFQSVAVTPNQWTVATALSHLFNTGQTGLDSLFAETFILTEAGAQQAFDNLSGVQHTHSQLALQQNTQRFQQVLSRRSQQPTGTLAYGSMPFDANADLLLAFNGDLSLLGASSATSLGNQAMAESERGWWIQGFGGVGEINDTRNASGADLDGAGLAIGIDTEWGEGVIGLAGSYTTTDVDAVSSDLDIDSYQLAVYGLWAKESGYLNTLLNYGQHTTDASRNISVGTLFNTANADYDSESLNVSIELGKSFGAGSVGAKEDGTTITPYISLAYQSLQQDRFVETGAGSMNLSVGSEKTDGVRTTLGIRLQDNLSTRSGKRLTPFVDIAYVRDDSNIFQLDAGFAAAPNTTFRVEGTELDKSRARLGFGLIGNLSERTIINLGYQGEFAGSDNRHNVAAALRFIW
ncbi:autotransporter domain-containing protein [Gammaproteobacteria bacterium]|nr:autotransporter domain-containing protein [Gammaproteobacteria bacterium]